MKTNKVGRPPKSPEELQTESIRIMVNKKDKEIIKKAARDRGLTVSDYIRMLFVGDSGKKIDNG